MPSITVAKKGVNHFSVESPNKPTSFYVSFIEKLGIN